MKKEVKGRIVKDNGIYVDIIPKELENERIIDRNKIIRVEKEKGGFESFEDVVEYVEKYFTEK